MRSILQLSAVSAGVLASRPMNEALLNEGILSSYLLVACSHDLEPMPKTIPQSVGGRNVAKFLCEWARLSEEDFLRRATDVVKETHDHVMEDVPSMREGLQRSMDSARRLGAGSDEEVLAVLAERYRQMLRSLNECQPILRH